jgi:hypothetical protein
MTNDLMAMLTFITELTVGVALTIGMPAVGNLDH